MDNPQQHQMPDRRDNSRPPIAAEIRAWIGVGVVLAVQIVGGVWWAATLSAQNSGMKDILTEVRQEMKGYSLKVDVDRRFDDQTKILLDHEARLRAGEAARSER